MNVDKSGDTNNEKTLKPKKSNSVHKKNEEIYFRMYFNPLLFYY